MLIALIPALAWGSIGLVSGKLGGTANQQTLGMTLGALLFSIIMTICGWNHFIANNSGRLWLVGLISGLFWSLGQNQQFAAMKSLGVSKAIPISTGAQLVCNTLAGVFLFHEWTTRRQLSIGSIALIILVIGATLTALRDRKNTITNNGRINEDWRGGSRALFFSTLGYLGYTVIIHWANVDTRAMVLPQAIGMVIGAAVFALGKDALRKETYKNIITGLIWGTGNLCMFEATAIIGLAVSFSLSQMGIVISTFGSIFLLGEKKTYREWVYIVIGSAMVILGGFLLGMLK